MMKPLKIIASIALVLSVLPVEGCRNRDNSSSTQPSGTPSDSRQPCSGEEELPAELAALGRDIAAGNAKAFAKACSYPIERPYPLRNITDSTSMESYFPVMIDDSIKQLIKSAGRHRWHHSGWRGWTLDRGEYLWWDGNLYAVNYISSAEKALLKRLADEEMESLAPELRKGWHPYFCLIGVDNGSIYRIDKSSVELSSDSIMEASQSTEAENAAMDADCMFRLLIYPKNSDLHTAPADSLCGTMNVEGSAGSRRLYFRNHRGHRAEFAMDVSDDSAPVIVIVNNSDSVEHPVERIYWRDYLAIPR